MLKSLKKSCSIAGHLNGRVEMHGEDQVRAFDLRVTLKLTRAQLNKFTGNDQLWNSWFQQSASDGDKPLLEHWAPYRWKPKFEGCKVALNCGDSRGVEEFDLGACKLKGFVFTPLDGGHTEVAFTVQALASEESCAILMHIGSDDVEIEVQFGALVVAQQDLQLDADEEDTEVSDATEPAPHGDAEQPAAAMH